MLQTRVASVFGLRVSFVYLQNVFFFFFKYCLNAFYSPLPYSSSTSNVFVLLRLRWLDLFTPSSEGEWFYQRKNQRTTKWSSSE